MKMRKPKYVLSTDEVDRLVKEESDRRRKLRIVQVREQAKANAALIRNKVKLERERLLSQFANEVKNELEAEKAEKVRKLEQKYDNTLRTVGQGHREVHIQGDGQNIVAQRERQQQANDNIAEERFKFAIEKQVKEKAIQQWEESKNIRNRQKALEMERDRAAAIAALPPPPPDISAELNKIIKKAIPMTDMKAFATTHFHIPDVQVVKETPEQQTYDAKTLAAESDLTLKQDLAEKKRSQHERIEKAHIRGNEALQREMLKHDLGDMLQDLSLLQRKDRRRRQALMSDVPKQVFIPPEHCMEERADREIEMERKFEEMYLRQPKSDSGSTQVWSENPSAVRDSSDMSSTQDTVPMVTGQINREINAALKDVTNVSKSASGKETVLKKLLDRIKEQRNNVVTSQRQTAPATLAIEKPASECDTHSVMSAESRASWKKTLGDEDFVIDSDRQSSVAVKLPTLGFDEPDLAKESSSGLDSATLAKTNVMIQELQQRIKVIEDQKLQLSEQLQSQSEFYKKLQQSQHSSRPLTSDTKRDENLSLDEISLTGSQRDNLNVSGVKSDNRSPLNRSRTRMNDDSPSIDLPSAVSNLRPVFGILKGPKNPAYELMTSNGFLPLPEMNQEGLEDKNEVDSYSPPSCLKVKANSPVQGQDVNVSADLSAVARDKDSSDRGARRMIDFRDAHSGPTVSFGKSQILGDGKTLEFLKQIEQSGYSSMNTSGGSLRQDDDGLGKRMKSYRLRAQNIQSSLDDDTLRKVREYQDRLLQTHEDRKTFLAEVRKDIELRRQALHNTSRYSSGVESHFMSLGAPATSSSGQPSSIQVGDYQGMHKFQDLKPIAPFIADPWVGRHNINKRGDFGAFGVDDKQETQNIQPESGQSGDIAAKYYGNKGSYDLDHIRKSLPFDDLNDSNFNASHVTDDANGTATPKSFALSDDSRLMSSEEERGSPILTGSRYDTSDKSNNSVTGSSSLNGSVLVARAEERREGFERRQEELRRQLTEIQSQKEAILERYYHGQQTLSQQQKSLKAKLASSVSSPRLDSTTEDEDDDDRKQARLMEKLSFFSSQSGTSGGLAPGQAEGGQSSFRTESLRKDLDTSDANSSLSWSGHLRKFQNSSDMKSGQARGSSSSGLPGDSYLDDISYHQIHENKAPTASSSLSQNPLPKLTSHSSSWDEGRFAFSKPGDSETRSTVGEQGNAPPTSTFQSWASILLSSQHNQDRTGQTSDPVVSGTASEEIAAGSQTPPAMARSGFQGHEPHELSTIIEVDTPTTSSVHGSNVKVASSSLSIPSLSQGSSISLNSKWDSDTKVDRFLDLPYTFPASSAGTGLAYDLTSGSEPKVVELGERGRGDRAGIALAETSKAARSLHFHPQEIEFGGLTELHQPNFSSLDDLRKSPSSAADHELTNGISFHSEGGLTLDGDESSLQSRSLHVEDKDESLESRSLSPDHLEKLDDPLAILQSAFPFSTSDEQDPEEELLSSVPMPDLVGSTPIKPMFQGEKDNGANQHDDDDTRGV